MKSVALIAGVAILGSLDVHSQAALPTIAVDSLVRDSTHWKAIVRITNATRQSFGVVGFRCAFFHQGRAVDSSGNVALNVAAGETVIDRVLGPHNDRPVDSASCRITYANP